MIGWDGKIIFKRAERYRWGHGYRQGRTFHWRWGFAFGMWKWGSTIFKKRIRVRKAHD